MTRLGSGVYRSVDGGETWPYLNRHSVRPFFFSQIRINPSNDQHVYVLDVNFWESNDGGRTLEKGARKFGYDFHAMWIDPNQHDRYYLGQDKGLFVTHDHGRTFHFFDNLPVTQYYAIGVDMRDPYVIYGGTQDNGSWAVPQLHARRVRHPERRHVEDALGRRHARCHQPRQLAPGLHRGRERQLPPLRRPDVCRDLWAAGALNVVNFEEVTGKPRPAAEAATDLAAFYAQMRADRTFRFNWQTPFIVSPHNGRTIYLGANHVLKSVDGGVSWRAISADLSNNDPETTRRDTGGLTPDSTGAETHATVVSLSESPLVPGLVWAGTDDGNVWVTRNDGATWAKVNAAIPGVPAKLWVSDVEASAHAAGTAYVCFDGHRSDDFGTWVFKTTDYGATWTNIGTRLPADQPVHVLTADRKNARLLFVGTEFGVFVTLDGGSSWRPLMNGMPTVAVHDLVIHPRDNDLIAGTHGRGLYVLDDITPLQQLTPAIEASDVHLFDQRPATWWVDQSRGGQFGDDTFAGRNPPSVRPPGAAMDRAKIVNTPVITWYLGGAPSGAGHAVDSKPGRHACANAVGACKGRHHAAGVGWAFRSARGLQASACAARRVAVPGGIQAAARCAGGRGCLHVRVTLGRRSVESVLRIREDPLVTDARR